MAVVEVAAVAPPSGDGSSTRDEGRGGEANRVGVAVGWSDGESCGSMPSRSSVLLWRAAAGSFLKPYS